VRDLHGGGFHREKPGYDPRDPRVCPADCGPHQQPAGMERFPIRVRHARQREPAMRRGIGSVVARRSTALPAMGSPNPPCDRNHGIEPFPFWHRDGHHGHTRWLTPLHGWAVVGMVFRSPTIHAVRVGQAASGIGFAGRGWGRGPQPKRNRFFTNDEFEDGRPLDPELPRDEVKEGQAFRTQTERRWMSSRRRGLWWQLGASVAFSLRPEMSS
jgi:hypothetical protein